MHKSPRSETERLYRFYYSEIRRQYRLQREDHTYVQTLKIMDYFVAWFNHHRSPNAVMREMAWKSFEAGLSDK